MRHGPVWMVALALSLLGCEGAPQEPLGGECLEPSEERGASLPTLGCAEAFSAMAARPDTAIFANTSLVKFVIDLQDDNATYFIDSRAYSLHYNFCRDNLEKEGLDPVGTHQEFNLRQYRRSSRRFLLGTLAHYAEQDLFTLEFATGDRIQAEQIKFAFEHVAQRVYFGDELRWRPVSGVHESIARGGLEDDVPVIYTDDLFLGVSYQPLNPAVGFGTLRLLGGQDAGQARPTDIVVLTEAPNDIPPVGGLITEAFQTPLSHVNVLSQNRGTPNMALPGALTDETLLALEGQLVRLEVTPQAWTVELADPADAEAFWESIRPAETFVPPLDLSETGLLDLAELGHQDVDKVGAKAANLAEMMNIEPALPLPHAPFAVPFYHYHHHMARHGLDERVEAMLADERFGADLTWRQAQLEALRADIADSPLHLGLRAQVYSEMLDRFGMEKVRFRSSTNSEDLPGFNGAGLYTSASGRVGDEDRRPEDVIREVWASLWNDRAVAEREFYRIDHAQVAMALLVHPSFPNEAANGVAFTTNPFNPRRPAHYVNAQLGEVSVVSPEPGVLSEQFLLYTWYESPEVEYLSSSSLLEQGRVLEWAEVLALSEALAQIHDHFRGIYEPSAPREWGMDVEFKLLGRRRELLIKQARPIPQ